MSFASTPPIHLSSNKNLAKLSKKIDEYVELMEQLENVMHVKLYPFIDSQNLEKVITDAPVFDILIISKTFYGKLPEQYTKWISNIQGTVCYIISRSGLEKISSMVTYNSVTDTFIFNTEHVFEVSDLYLYTYVNTWVYKYNIVSSLDEESTIHSHHLDNHKRSSQIQLNNILTDLFN